MLGAIIGDICGSRYEFQNNKSKDIELFKGNVRFTDDSVMTVAVAAALMDTYGRREKDQYQALVRAMQYYGNLYSAAGYGRRFSQWLEETDPQPYNSWGNGSAMRVCAAGWLYDSIEETLDKARLTALPTHDHEEGIKGAEAIAAAIFFARKGKNKDVIKAAISDAFDYDLDFTLDEIRDDYDFDVSCMGSVPQAIRAFYESEDFESCIRLAISIGGDSDTIACMAGAIAEAYYGIPEWIKEKAYHYLPDTLSVQVKRFYQLLRNTCLCH